MTLQFEILFPLTFLIIFTLVFLWYGIYVNNKIKNYNLAYYFGYISIFILLFTLFLELTSFLRFDFRSSSELALSTQTAFSYFFILTPFSYILINFTLIISILVILSCISIESQVNSLNILETNVLRLFIIFSLNLIIISDNLIVIFLLLEIYSLSSYILVGKTSKHSLFSSEASIKYFFIGSVFSILMIYSLGNIYATTGLLDISSLKLLINDPSIYFSKNPELYFFSIILLFSIFFKLAAAPFHFWSPDVYEGSPTTVMFFLSVVPKITLFYLLVKINFLFLPIWYIFVISAFISIFIGSFIGLFQTKFKRLLAYSMISNTGLLLLLLSWSNDYLVLVYFFLYLFIYNLTLVGLFSIFLSNRVSYNGLIIKNIINFANFRELNFTKFIIFTVLLFTSAGIPPFIGFFIKFFVLYAYIENSLYFYGMLLVVLFIMIPSIFYYIRVLKIMSFIKKRFWIFYSDTSYLLVFSIVFSFVVSILATLWFSVFSDLLLLLLI